MIENLIDYFKEKKDNLKYLIKISGILIGAKTISIFLFRQYMMFETNLANQSVNVLYTFLFDKILKVSPSSTKIKSNQGEIVTYLQVDCGKFSNMITNCANLFIFPTKIVVYLILLFRCFGFTFLYGIIPLLICVLINSLNYLRYPSLEKDFMNRKDMRSKATIETLEALKILKMYTWEKIFRKKVRYFPLLICFVFFAFLLFAFLLFNLFDFIF